MAAAMMESYDGKLVRNKNIDKFFDGHFVRVLSYISLVTIIVVFSIFTNFR